MSGILYSGSSRWALPMLAVVMAMLLTWSFLIANVWLGYSGRPGFYYSFVAVGMAGLLAVLYSLVWWAESPRTRDNFIVNVLPWLPWLLAAAIAAKAWAAAACASLLHRRRLVSGQQIAIFLCVWLAATSCLMYRVWLLSPRVEWLQDTLLLVALCMVPAARLAAVQLTLAWNRHR